jgi:hypothetical protein
MSRHIFNTLYATSFYRHFNTTGWVGRLFPVKKKASPFFKGEAFKITRYINELTDNFVASQKVGANPLV